MTQLSKVLKVGESILVPKKSNILLSILYFLLKWQNQKKKSFQGSFKLLEKRKYFLSFKNHASYFSLTKLEDKNKKIFSHASLLKK